MRQGCQRKRNHAEASEKAVRESGIVREASEKAGRGRTRSVQKMEKLTGYVDHIIYRNEENGYTVLEFVSKSGKIACVGMAQPIEAGDLLQLDGAYVEHGTYGRQFQFTSYAFETPKDEVSMERYLGSGAIKGVGQALAARIVRAFHADTFRIIEEEPERLAEIKGISARMARDISAQVEEKKDVRGALLFLQQYGIPHAMALRIYAAYGSELYTIVRENPYRLADDISGVGFRIADEIASRVGILADSEFRVRSGIAYVLSQAVSQGHVFLPKQELFARARDLLGASQEALEDALPDLAIARKIVVKEDAVYLASNYYVELETAKMLHDLNLRADVPQGQIDRRLDQIAQQMGTGLAPLQREAVAMAVRHGLLVVTGGPGTGKTTTIDAMIRYFAAEGMDVALAAPTGRAAKRMTEATSCEAQTIHRLLEVAGAPDERQSSMHFGRNQQYPLDADVVIVDEVSMVDIYLMHALLLAISPGTRLILVGDANQLPSVGPGNVLRDIIRSERFQVVRLSQIFRQAVGSDIVVNAHKINQGEHVPLDNKSRDFFFLKRKEADVIVRVVLSLVAQKLPGYVDATPFDIQVLTPMRKGLVGVERLNPILQNYLNPPSSKKREKEYANGIFREGDKVMQIKNNYQKAWEMRGKNGIAVECGTGVFNGDIGIVHAISPHQEELTVAFDDGKFVDYAFQELGELELAYAVTVHKSQGSEYPAVVIPLLPGPAMLMNRNLLYTAITRARKCVTLVGSADVFEQMIDNRFEQKRYTTLQARICEWND